MDESTPDKDKDLAETPAVDTATPEQPEVPAKPETTPFDTFSEGEDDTTISWVASEFLEHTKPAGWYLAVVLAAIALAAVIFLLTHDFISTGVIVFVGIVLAAYGARKPRQLQYALNHQGIQIAERYFSFSEFRSFSVQDEGAVRSIVFTPLKRFGQLLTIYVDPADEDRIIDLLSNSLPMEKSRNDMVDNLMKRIRF